MTILISLSNNQVFFRTFLQVTWVRCSVSDLECARFSWLELESTACDKDYVPSFKGISAPFQWTPGSLCISPPSVWSRRGSRCEHPTQPASAKTNIFVRRTTSQYLGSLIAEKHLRVRKMRRTTMDIKTWAFRPHPSQKSLFTAKKLPMSVWLIPAPAEVAAQPSSGLHISFHLCSCHPFHRQQRISRPHPQEHSRCGTRTN